MEMIWQIGHYVYSHTPLTDVLVLRHFGRANRNSMIAPGFHLATFLYSCAPLNKTQSSIASFQRNLYNLTRITMNDRESKSVVNLCTIVHGSLRLEH